MLRVFWFVIFMAICTVASAADVKVFAEIQQNGAYEQQPLKGMVTVTHEKNDPVDVNSFRLEKEKLDVDFVKDVQISPPNPTVLSIYSFQIPGQPAGLYALPAVTVRVGSKEYRSYLSSYSVMARPNAQQTPAPLTSQPLPSSLSSSPPSVNSRNVSLRLEAGINGPTTIYPGQRTQFQYHYYFEGNIGLTVEKLPLLDAEGFIKIGEKEIKDSSEGSTSISSISQEVEAVKPGTYSFGPSAIEGYAYKNDAGGNPVYTSSKLTSEVPAVTVTVLPFPEKDKPASFNGAVGKFTFQTDLVSSSDVDVGDDLSLAMLISGKGNIKGVPIPDLCCQPGFSGFFKQSDLPPVEEVSEGTKKAVVKLRVLTDQVEAIPSAEFSSFDPDLSQYVVLHSNSIPIKVKPMTPASVSSPLGKSQPKRIEKPVERTRSIPAPIEIESIIPLKAGDLYNRPFGTWWVMAVVPIAVALLLYQEYLRNFLAWRRSQQQMETSDVLFKQAFSVPGKCDFDQLRRSLILALVESKQIPSATTEQTSLPEQGVSGEVKILLSMFDEKRFAGKDDLKVNEVRSQVRALLDKIRRSHEA
ncbi:MAG: hypothetical protein WCF65_09225 [Parachlamydiaceae bacterium]